MNSRPGREDFRRLFIPFLEDVYCVSGHYFILVVSKWLLYLPSCRPKEVKLFEDKDGNLATYIEDCVSSGKFLQIYLPVIAF